MRTLRSCCVELSLVYPVSLDIFHKRYDNTWTLRCATTLSLLSFFVSFMIAFTGRPPSSSWLSLSISLSRFSTLRRINSSDKRGIKKNQNNNTIETGIGGYAELRAKSRQLFVYTICCSLPENILSLTPTSNSLTQKYIHFIQSTFTSVDTQPMAFHSANRRQLTPFYYTLGIIKFQLGKISLLPFSCLQDISSTHLF